MIETKKSSTKKKPVKKKKPVRIATQSVAGGPEKAKKKVIKKETKKIIKAKPKLAKYLETVGRRKTATARVRLFTRGEKLILVNKKPYQDYFPTLELQQVVTASLEIMKSFDKFRISAKVRGGGIHAQAEAVRHGISRALVEFNPDFRKRLRKAGFLTRDPRMRERKKFGLKRARKAPQWAKR